MRIKAITLKDFRNHRNTRIECDRLTVIKGPNGAGKSSIRQALEVALTGRCEATDRAGRGLADLIRSGAKEAEIILEIEGLGEVRRRIRPSGSSLQVAGWSGSTKVQQELLFRELGTDADQVAALLNVGYFLDLPPKEQTEMLFRLAGAVTKDHVLEAVQSSGAEWPADMDIPDRPTADWFDRAYREIYARRREARKALERARGRLEGMAASGLPGGVSPGDLPRIEEELRALEKRRDEVLRRRAEAAAARTRKAELERSLQSMRSELSGRKEELAECEPTVDAEEAAECLERARGEEAELGKAAAGLAVEIRALDGALAALKKTSGKCPLAPEIISCPLQGEKLKALVKELEGKRGGLVREHEAAVKRGTEIAAEIRALEEVLGRERQRELLLSEIAQLEADISSLEKELTGLPPADEAQDEDLKGLEEEIHKLMELAAGLRARERAQAERARLAEEVARLEAEAENLEILAALLGPGKDGIRASFLRLALGELHGRISANLESLMPWSSGNLVLETDPEFRLTLRGLEVRQLSASERMRLGIAVSEALAHLSGLRLLVIDDVEMLDAGNRALLSSFLLSRAEIDTIVAISVADEAEEPGVDGVSLWWVEGGYVQRVKGRVKAA
jgi:DNA repair exonuclease SbcCD ATPase subunit